MMYDVEFWFPAHILPGLFLILMCFIGHDPYVCVAIITASLGFNGAATMTNLQNSQDLAPNYAGSLYGIINFIGTTSGFISPMIVAYFTAEKVRGRWKIEEGNQNLIRFQSTLDEWQNIFFIGAIVYIAPAIIFMLFGSGEVQKWNQREEKKDVESEEHATRL
jgi:MFS transporter, ACS family, solute carrier family 17 (sodium-dependent inorganic phosphate cotransporter), other